MSRFCCTDGWIENLYGPRHGARGDRPAGQPLAVLGELLGYVAGALGEGSQDLHALIQASAESRVAFKCRSSGRQEPDRQLGLKVT